MGTLIENLVNSGELSIETILSEAKEFEENYWVHRSGLIISTKKGAPRILKDRVGGGGSKKYKRLTVCLSDKRYDEYVHRIVAKVFIDNPEGKEQVNHKNGNTLDNSVENLEWVTHLENLKHSWDTCLSKRGVSCSYAKTTEETVIECFTLYQKGFTPKYIRDVTGLSRNQVDGIIYKKNWRHITEPLERATTIPNGSTQ